MSNRQRLTGMVAIAALAIMVFTVPAGATPMRFDNPPPGPGHFEWYGGTGSDPIGLNVTLPAGDQTGEVDLPAVIRQQNYEVFTGLQCFDVDRIQTDADQFIAGVDAGELIPSGFPWMSFGYTNYPGCPSPLPYDVETYLGVSFDLGSGDQYGWIGVVFSSADYTVDAFAWGYETEVGVPIPAGVPEPGTLALLAIGATALLRRRA